MEGLGINWKILVGQLINFIILFFLLKKFVFKAFFSILEKRKKIIEDGVKKSTEAEENLVKIRSLETEVRKSGENRAKIIQKEAEEKAKTRSAEILALAETEKADIIKRAKETAQREIESEKERREKESIERSFILAEKFLKVKIDKEKDSRFLEEIAAKIK